MARPDLSAASTGELRAAIRPHEGAGLRACPLYLAALAERDRRLGLEPAVTRAFLEARAAERRFASYGEVAEANGRDWSARMRTAVPLHLDALNAHCAAEGAPLLSAIVVTRAYLAWGRMAPGTLAGVAAGARALGRDVPEGDAADFLAAEQARVFAAAAR